MRSFQNTLFPLLPSLLEPARRKDKVEQSQIHLLSRRIVDIHTLNKGGNFRFGFHIIEVLQQLENIPIHSRSIRQTTSHCSESTIEQKDLET